MMETSIFRISSVWKLIFLVSWNYIFNKILNTHWTKYFLLLYIILINFIFFPELKSLNIYFFFYWMILIWSMFNVYGDFWNFENNVFGKILTVLKSAYPRNINYLRKTRHRIFKKIRKKCEFNVQRELTGQLYR